MINNTKLAENLESDIGFKIKLNIYDSISPNWPLAFLIAEEINVRIRENEAIFDFKNLAIILNDKGLAELSMIIADVSKKEINGVSVWATENAGPTSRKLTFEPNFLTNLLDDLKGI